ncbi:RAMP superfamily CRISPR-associated protein [Desulfobacterium sp. N47]|uniref:CRISPR type III-associated protein domain-containing protein n=1 Tax=uncultured Desulfobacterium sp. TaxID=201089 RepID=E1YF69_9BACT|nr:unknown protein [uncultured Desulfobacterium sp.]
MSRTTSLTQLIGVANITWSICTITPLCIKSGTTSVWKQAGGNGVKTRLVNAEFDFFNKKKVDQKNKESKESNVYDFYFDVDVENNESHIRYHIPASSIRGAIRNYTIKRLIPKKYWTAALDATGQNSDDQANQTDEDDKTLVRALKEPGWHIIQNLFGLSIDKETEELMDESVAGRITFRVDDLSKLDIAAFKSNLISGSWGKNKVIFPSTHGKMVLTTRNPLGRITQGAKEGGLHTFMELAPGNEFKVHIKIINPTLADLGLIAFWEKSINNGLIRLGGLTSVGRGRLNIKESIINLYLKNPAQFNGIQLDNGTTPENDILSGIFSKYIIPNWAEAGKCCMAHLNEFYKNNGKEAKNDSQPSTV